MNTMTKLFTAMSTTALILCAIWGYLWLEIWRDPKGELTDFFAQNPRAEAWITKMSTIWVTALLTGLIFLALA